MVVQILLWKHPVDPDGFLVLKAPQIGGADRRVRRQCSPRRDFVITDRDPFRCIVSIAVMGESIIEPFCIDNPLTDDGTRHRQILSWVKPKLAALAAFTATPERVTHVAYPSLVGEPVATVDRVLSSVGIGMSENLVSRVDGFLDAQRSGARAAPPRELPDDGLHPRRGALRGRHQRLLRRNSGSNPSSHGLTGAQPSI